MESLFVALASTSLFVTWISSTQLVSLHGTCRGGEQYAAVATQNAATLQTASLAPFGRTEQGWGVYEAQVAATVGTRCASNSKRFAADLARWQSRNRLRVTGAVDVATLGAMKQRWQSARPFIRSFAHGACPTAADDEALAAIGRNEGWRGKPGQLNARALDALRRMVAAARAADPRIKADRQMLTIVSAFRSPAYDAAKCAAGANCNGIAKARCSAHRTGTAVDLYVGAAPGHSPVDTAEPTGSISRARPLIAGSSRTRRGSAL